MNCKHVVNHLPAEISADFLNCTCKEFCRPTYLGKTQNCPNRYHILSHHGPLTSSHCTLPTRHALQLANKKASSSTERCSLNKTSAELPVGYESSEMPSIRQTKDVEAQQPFSTFASKHHILRSAYVELQRTYTNPWSKHTPTRSCEFDSSIELQLQTYFPNVRISAPI